MAISLLYPPLGVLCHALAAVCWLALDGENGSALVSHGLIPLCLAVLRQEEPQSEACPHPPTHPTTHPPTPPPTLRCVCGTVALCGGPAIFLRNSTLSRCLSLSRAACGNPLPAPGEAGNELHRWNIPEPRFEYRPGTPPWGGPPLPSPPVCAPWGMPALGPRHDGPGSGGRGGN